MQACCMGQLRARCALQVRSDEAARRTDAPLLRRGQALLPALHVEWVAPNLARWRKLDLSPEATPRRAGELPGRRPPSVRPDEFRKSLHALAVRSGARAHQMPESNGDLAVRGPAELGASARELLASGSLNRGAQSRQRLASPPSPGTREARKRASFLAQPPHQGSLMSAPGAPQRPSHDGGKGAGRSSTSPGKGRSAATRARGLCLQPACTSRMEKRSASSVPDGAEGERGHRSGFSEDRGPLRTARSLPASQHLLREHG
jgi:hypothetical protein